MNPITNDSGICEESLQALKQVLDPEIGLNIVDLGLVYQVDFDADFRKLYCTMTLTTQFCPMGESITDAAKQVLQERFPDYQVELNLTFDPGWTQDRITEAGLEFLNQE